MRLGWLRIYTFSCLWAICLISKGQVGDRRSDFAIGGNVGMVMNSMSFQPSIKQNQLMGMTFGLAGRYVSEKYFTCICGLQAELNYTALGWKENIEDSQDTYYRTVPYIQLPLLMQLGWGKERKGCKFIFEAGPQFGYALGYTEHKSDPFNMDNRPNNVIKQYGMDIDSKIDYGITAGLGLEYSNSGLHFILSARYYYGLGDMFDNSKKGYFGRSANQTICAKIVFLYDLKQTKNINQ